MRILLVDDNEANRLVARLLLEREGHVVLCAENGRDALDQCKSIKFDIILMDIMMPVMDGIKTLGRLRRLKTQNIDTPVYALTAYCSPFDRKYYGHIGFDHVLVKPLKLGDIKADGSACDTFMPDENHNIHTRLDNTKQGEPVVVQTWQEFKNAVRVIEVNLVGALKNDDNSLLNIINGGERLATGASQAGFHDLAAIAKQLEIAASNTLETASTNILAALMPSLLKNLDDALLQLTQKHIKDSSLADRSYDVSELTKSGQIQSSRS